MRNKTMIAQVNRTLVLARRSAPLGRRLGGVVVRLCLLLGMCVPGFAQVNSYGLSPSSGSAAPGTFVQFTVSGADYYDDWTSTNDYLAFFVLPASAGSPSTATSNACMVEFQPQTWTTFLLSYDGNPVQVAGQGGIPSTTPLHSNQCTVSLATATHQRVGAGFTVTFQVSFTSSFVGQTNLWVGVDYQSSWSWYQGGTFTVLPISVTVGPAGAPVYSSLTQQFIATVANDSSNSGVTWSASAGSITQPGLYTAPATSSEQTATVTATSVADNTKSGSASVTLLPAVAWYNSGWAERKPVAANSSKVNTATHSTTALANFPMLVSVTDPDLIYTANGGKVANDRGSDIVFTAIDGVTPLNYEIEYYNPATGQLIAWVKIPSLSATASTVIYEYFGNPSAPAPALSWAQGAWDSNFMGVWHLSQIW